MGAAKIWKHNPPAAADTIFMKMISHFAIYGLIGWCMEILWTGAASALRRDYRLTANTSVWMFFIYGCAAFMEPLCDALVGMPFPLRGWAYALCIFAAEFIAGAAMKRAGVCPWDYGGARYSVAGVIRLDYAPAWFAAGLAFEFVHFNILA